MEDQEKNKEKDNKKVKFNLGQAYLEMLARMIEKAAAFRTNDDLDRWFKQLKSIKTKITRMSKDDRSKLLKLEVGIGRGFPIKRDYTPLGTTKEDETKNSQAFYQKERLLDEYEFELMQIIDKLAYLVPSEKDRTGVFGQDDDEV